MAAANVGETRSSSASAVLVAAIFTLPRTVKIGGAIALGLGALLAVGVPLASVTPLLAVGGCLGMHLLMGHGAHGGHGDSDTSTHVEPAPDSDAGRQ